MVVIKHWKIHNYIPKDRYKPTVYTEEKALLEAKENGAYTQCIQDVYTDKKRLDKGSVEKEEKSEELNNNHMNLRT